MGGITTLQMCWRGLWWARSGGWRERGWWSARGRCQKLGSAVVVTSALPFPFSYRVPRDSITPRILKNLIVVWLFIAALAPAGFFQTEHILTVKVLDARNGKPLKHMRLWLAW